MIKIKFRDFIGKHQIKTLSDIIERSKEFYPPSGISRLALMRLRDSSMKRIDLDLLNALCKTLKCKVSDLIEYIDDKN